MDHQRKWGSLTLGISLVLWRAIYTPLFRRAAHHILKGRLLDPNDPEKGRWLASDVREFLRQMRRRTDSLLPLAELEELPTAGNRHNVYLTAVTVAAYQVLLDRGTDPVYARTLVGDVGWKVYDRMLKTVSLPCRILTRDPGKRMRWVIKLLMIFPFSTPGKPGYEAKVWSEGSDTYTHWTHCPPHTFVRRLVDTVEDRGERDAFYHTWCLYDWPGADSIANDGKHGHYSRPHTMSLGYSVCDMCWRGKAP